MNDLLNDPTDERLDDRLRTLMRTAVAEPPAPPSLADLDTLVSVGPEPRNEWFRPLTAVAAAVAVLAVGALVLWPSAEDDVDPADSTVPEVVAGQFLDAYYLPSELPDGWQIVEVLRYSESVTEMDSNSIVVARRDGSERGVVSVTLSSRYVEATVAPDSVEVYETDQAVPVAPGQPVWDPDGRALSWVSGGDEIRLQVGSGDETSARELADGLVEFSGETGRQMSVAEDSDWVVTKQYAFAGKPVAFIGSNTITLGGPTGEMIQIWIGRASGPRLDEWMDPVAGTEDLFQSFDVPEWVTMTRFVEDISITATAVTGGPEQTSASAEVVQDVLATSQKVSESSWLSAAPDPNALVRSAEVVATFDLLDHTITAHRDGATSGICIDRADGANGCAFLYWVEPDGSLPQAAPTTGIPLSDGTWVAVGDIEADFDPCEGAELQGARAAVTPNGDQQVMFVVPASLNESFACSLYRDGTANGVFIATPPTNR